MPMSYFFRVFVQDASDYDNDQDEWLSFDSVYVTPDLEQPDTNIFQDEDQERAARSELQRIAKDKRFRAMVHKDTGIHTLRTLFSLSQQELIVATEIELYKYNNKQGKDEAILLLSSIFNSIITGYSVNYSGNYAFRFQIIGDVGLGDASDMSGLPGMAEKETQVGLSPPSARKGRQLVAAFMGINDAASVRMRFWVEAVLAGLFGFLGILTLFTRDWIEALTGFDPDNNNGSFEWAIVAALFLVCIVLSIAARADWHRLSATTPNGI